MPKSNKKLKGHLRSMKEQLKAALKPGDHAFSKELLKKEIKWVKAQKTINRKKSTHGLPALNVTRPRQDLI